MSSVQECKAFFQDSILQQDTHILVCLKDQMVAQNDTGVSCIPQKSYPPNGLGWVQY